MKGSFDLGRCAARGAVAAAAEGGASAPGMRAGRINRRPSARPRARVGVGAAGAPNGEES